MDRIRFLDDEGTFALRNPEEISYLYFPLAGEAGLKSAITPTLGGDSKLDQETFLLEPVSAENLHNNRSTRNFWCVTEDGCWSASGASAEQEAMRFTPEQDESELTAGLLWQTVRRESRWYGLHAELTSFVPPRENVEILYVRIINTSDKAHSVRAVAAIPIYGRSADNVRDHRNVTSMLHRVRTTERGVLVKPTMSFDEKGHRENRRIYYVLGSTGNGGLPEAFYPTLDAFLGEGGTFLRPRAVYENLPGVGAETSVDGREAMGGVAFPTATLQAGESAEYIVLLGVSEDAAEIERIQSAYGTAEKVRQALEETRQYWRERVNLRFHTGSAEYDRWLRWVGLQPFLRRIYGCSFLPHHDYGRGGRGWRDLWQDCLSLLLMDPSGVREMLVKNFGGVRLDGTNATIIGEGDGNFIADRNGIARVWMDHALWPLMTAKLYIDQTGDLGILTETAPYFKDPQAARGTEIDRLWEETDGNRQRTENGEVYPGSVLEHLLIQHLTGFYEVGAHNVYRLRGADWNDALDMAGAHGESVAFTCAYAGNLRDLAALIRSLDAPEISLPEELSVLLTDDRQVYESVSEKTAVLERYTQSCKHTLSGRRVTAARDALADNLEGKADWLIEHLRAQEWIDAGDGKGWFNSYYDDHERRVEGIAESGVRMMLTGQVFAIMSGTATDDQIAAITRSADKYLYRNELGGYRLNTDFHELKFDMGRMFGFAYGEKENGAVFSHMAVMYANALYRRGFAREGHRALQSLADAALNFETSRIYPGIPEYFRADGRGMYHYLTGAASWYLLTMVTEVFGVHGELGDLVIAPKLLREQFDEGGKAILDLRFGGKRFRVTVVNLQDKDYGEYAVNKACLANPAAKQLRKLTVESGRAILRREDLAALPENGNEIVVELM
ncbi:MAG: cellobiose phosphorylase [Oscillospiraceae bacterium]|nr:cellobiose phosphorylase [Oscillospiraceae bacterium]